MLTERVVEALQAGNDGDWYRALEILVPAIYWEEVPSRSPFDAKDYFGIPAWTMMDLVLEGERDKRHLGQYDPVVSGCLAKNTKGLYYLVEDIDNPVQNDQPDQTTLPFWGFLRPGRSAPDDTMGWILGEITCRPWEHPIPTTQGKLWGFRAALVRTTNSSPMEICAVSGLEPTTMIEKVIDSLVSYEQEQAGLVRLAAARNRELHAVVLAITASK